MSAAPTHRYRAEASDQWILRALDDIMLVHHRRSGQTHMMVSPAPEILAALRGRDSADAGDVAAILAADYDLGDAADAEAAIAAHLEEMAGLGLVHHA